MLVKNYVDFIWLPKAYKFFGVFDKRHRIVGFWENLLRATNANAKHIEAAVYNPPVPTLKHLPFYNQLNLRPSPPNKIVKKICVAKWLHLNL